VGSELNVDDNDENLDCKSMLLNFDDMPLDFGDVREVFSTATTESPATGVVAPGRRDSSSRPVSRLASRPS
jgi:hypothetical protein